MNSCLPTQNPYLNRVNNLPVVQLEGEKFTNFGGQLVPKVIAYCLIILAGQFQQKSGTLTEQIKYLEFLKEKGNAYLALFSADKTAFPELVDYSGITLEINEDNLLEWSYEINNNNPIVTLNKTSTNVIPATNNGPLYKSCIHPPTFVFTDPTSNINFYASSAADLYKGFIPYDNTLCIISLATVTHAKIDANHNISSLIKTLPFTIRMEWADYQPAIYTKATYLALIEHIRALKVTNVIVHCQAGHGRTGSMLAILAGLLNVSDEPIELIREMHYEKCVETKAQENYVIRIIS